MALDRLVERGFPQRQGVKQNGSLEDSLNGRQPGFLQWQEVKRNGALERSLNG